MLHVCGCTLVYSELEWEACILYSNVESEHTLVLECSCCFTGVDLFLLPLVWYWMYRPQPRNECQFQVPLSLSRTLCLFLFYTYEPLNWKEACNPVVTSECEKIVKVKLFCEREPSGWSSDAAASIFVHCRTFFPVSVKCSSLKMWSRLAQFSLQKEMHTGKDKGSLIRASCPFSLKFLSRLLWKVISISYALLFQICDFRIILYRFTRNSFVYHCQQYEQIWFQ